MKAELLKKIASRRALVSVIGLGYAGFPVLHHFAKRGFPTLGFDIDKRKVRSVNAGRSYIESIPSADLRKYKIRATDDFRRLREPDAVVISVPTPLAPDGRPDLSYVKKSTQSVARTLREGQLVVLESTTYPGTTRDVSKPILDRVGKPYFLGYAPERIDPGNKVFTVKNTPRLVSGIDDDSGELVEALYGAVLPKVVRVRTCEVAEMAKLLENIYRAVNIAMVNELKMVLAAMGIDIWEVIAAAATKPFGFQRFDPGPGMGGHCIPVDPFYLSWKAREVGAMARFIDLAGQVNVQMPFYVVQRLEAALRERGRKLAGAKVLVLGVAYKRNTDDARESPGLKVMEILQDRGVRIAYSDPHVPSLRKMRHYHFKLNSTPTTPAALKAFDAAVMITDHDEFDLDTIVRASKLIVDTRNAFAAGHYHTGKVVQA